ncbi:hypothetical protein BKA82DRAFT_4013558 [Pisolithus tinctorius]|nr:hypothetical protein BKA82DRAFT_4013558 [Pisolithus tinctorius]
MGVSCTSQDHQSQGPVQVQRTSITPRLRPDRPVTDSLETRKGAPGLQGRCSKGQGWRPDPKTAEAECQWGNKEGVEDRDWPSLGLGAAPEVHRGPETNIGESGGQMSDETPVFSTVELDEDSWARVLGQLRDSLGELTEVSPVVEAGSGASPEGNSDLEVGSSMSTVSGVMQPRGVQSAKGHQLPLCFSRDLQAGLWSQMRGIPMSPNGQGHG